MRHLHDQLFTFFVVHSRDRRGIPVKGLLDPLLPPVRQDVLVEVTLRVHEPDGDNRNAEIAALFEMVTGKETQPSGVHRKGVVQTIFRGEVCNGQGTTAGILFQEPAGRGVHVAPEAVHDNIVPPQVLLILFSSEEELLRGVPEHSHRVVDARLPCQPVELLKEDPRLGMPAPPEIVGKVGKTFQLFWDMGKTVASSGHS